MSSSTRSARRLPLAALAVLLLLAVPASAGATTRFVSLSGNDAANNCTSSTTPCRHIKYAATQAATGDTVDVGPGTFIEGQILVDKPMTFEGRGAGQTIVNGQSAAVPGFGGLFLSDTPSVGDITIDGFTLTGGIKGGAGNPAVNPEPFLIFVTKMPAGGTLTVSNNDLVTDSTVDPALATDYSVGVYVHGSGADVRVLDNLLKGFFQAVFLEASAGRATVAGNDFNGLLGSDCESPPLPVCDGSGFQFPLGVFILQYDVNNTQLKSIENNTFRNFNGTTLSLNAGFFSPATLGNVELIANKVDTGPATDSPGGRHPSVARIVAGPGGVINGMRVIGNDLSTTGPSAELSPMIWSRDFGSPAGSVSGVQAHFNRFRGNAPSAVRNDSAPAIDATHNWWGCNGGPGASGCLTKDGTGAVTSSPHLVLSATASPTSVFQHQSSGINANVARDSNGNTPAGNVFPAGVPMTFGTSMGTVTPANAVTTSPFASSVFSSPTAGIANVSSTLDSQTLTSPVTVNAQPAGPPAPSTPSTPTPSTPAAPGELPAAPTISFASPDENATLGLGGQTTVSLNVAVPGGLGNVTVAFNGRAVCTITAAPFTCQFQPRSSDGGRDGTLSAIVSDRNGRSASASRAVTVGGPATLGSHTGQVSKGVARIRIKCAAFGPCAGTIAMRSRIGGRRSPLTGIGSTGFDIGAGQTKTITLDVSNRGLQLLRAKGFLGTRTTVTTGDTAITRNLVLHQER
jgi:hypothetical protein